MIKIIFLREAVVAGRGGNARDAGKTSMRFLRIQSAFR